LGGGVLGSTYRLLSRLLGEIQADPKAQPRSTRGKIGKRDRQSMGSKRKPTSRKAGRERNVKGSKEKAEAVPEIHPICCFTEVGAD